MTQTMMKNDGKPLGAVITELAEKKPKAVAFVADGIAVDRHFLDVQSSRLAGVLAMKGAGADEMVVVINTDPLQFVVATIATWKLGATPVPVSHRTPPAELKRIADLVDAAVVVGTDRLTTGRPTVEPGTDPQPDTNDRPLVPAVASSWKAPTSGGSTGTPKVIQSTEPGLFNSRHLTKWRIEPETTMVIPAPLYHNGPFQVAMYGILSGCKVVHTSRFEPEATLAAVQRHAATWIYLVPTMMSRIWNLPADERNSYNVESLETVWHLAAPCPQWLKRVWIDWLGPDRVWELYSATEAIAWTIIGGREWLEHPGSVGRVAAGCIRILDDQANSLPPGEVGEIFMHPGERGQTYRYIGAEPRSIDGWDSLGDMGYFDTDGYLYLRDRKTDMVLVGGVNVYPAEVEAVIERHPDVISAVVLGLPDPDLGQRLHAIVEARTSLTEERIQRKVAAELDPHKIPRTVEFVIGPLRDDAGKVNREQLRAGRVVDSGTPYA